MEYRVFPTPARNLIPKGALVTHTRKIHTYRFVITDKIFAVWYAKRIGDLSNIKKKKVAMTRGDNPLAIISFI